MMSEPPKSSDFGGSRISAARVGVLLRRWARSNSLGHIGVAIVVGALAGAAVVAMTRLAEAAHVLFFGLPFDERLSAQARVAPLAAFLTLGTGGLALGLLAAWRRASAAPPRVDPVEANALYGGRLSLAGSLAVAAETMASNGVGASVGLESGYAQIGAAIGSRLGLALRLRRGDQRMMLGAGAAGAMAAAFGAPLTGAFYAFELVIGLYSLANAGPVLAAAVAGALAAATLGGAPYVVSAPTAAGLGVAQHLALVGLGLVAALLAILAMRASALLDRAFRASRLPLWAQPVLGGLVVAAIASFTPQVLGAGHGALQLDTPRALAAWTLAALILVKLFASLVSLASGFRGGLFFASMFVGALLGKLYWLAFVTLAPGVPLDSTSCLFAGMATFGVSIIGAPLTMTFLVLESSGDLPLAGGVLAAVIAAHLAVRLAFGYSFASWKRHLRGADLDGARDVGWRRDLTVAKLMDRLPATALASMTLDEFRAAHPMAGAPIVALVDEAGRYAGLVAVADAHVASGPPTQPIAELATQRATTLLPEADARSALAAFEAVQADVLAVVNVDRVLLGLLAETHVAKRLADALDLAARDALDES